MQSNITIVAGSILLLLFGHKKIQKKMFYLASPGEGVA
jgi:hypothetical protein